MNIICDKMKLLEGINIVLKAIPGKSTMPILDCIVIDVNNNGPDIIDWLIDNKLGHLSGKIKQSGFCVYPEFIFNLDEIKKYIYE